MWKGRVLMGVRRTGEALERRAILVMRDMFEYNGDVRVLFLVFEVPEEECTPSTVVGEETNTSGKAATSFAQRAYTRSGPVAVIPPESGHLLFEDNQRIYNSAQPPL